MEHTTERPYNNTPACNGREASFQGHSRVRGHVEGWGRGACVTPPHPAVVSISSLCALGLEETSRARAKLPGLLVLQSPARTRMCVHMKGAWPSLRIWCQRWDPSRCLPKGWRTVWKLRLPGSGSHGPRCREESGDSFWSDWVSLDVKGLA